MKTLKEIKDLAKKFNDKLQPIKVALFDVDGILTDGKIFWASEEVGWNRSTHSKDGYALKLLQRGGIKVGIITGGDSLGVLKRFKENLGVDFLHMGNEYKIDAFNEVLEKGYMPEEVLYMGDELFDIPILQQVGFSATVRKASPEVLAHVDYISEVNPGEGAVREVVDILRYAKNIHPEGINY